MPRSSPLLPSSDNHPYSKSEKTKKPFLSSPHTSRTPLPLIVFSTFCLLIGISGTIFSLLSLSRNQSTPVFRCGRVHDTFRGHYLSTSHNQRSSNINGVAGNSLDRPKFLGFVGILTEIDSVDRRNALRSTWFPSDPQGLLRLEHATGLAFRFVIGRSKDAKKMAHLNEEVEKYKDFMRIDVDEEYASPPYKTLAFFIAAFDLFEADYYVKVSDDIYLRPDRLATLLAKERTESRTYIGCMKKGPVITDPKMKWYESQGHLIGNEYFLHAYAPLYVLSAEVVASLATSRNNSSFYAV
ncbi:probable beta-1,3-galactosyltransferase 12 isoform X2 [Beta vulgaris subsp. vulgaris]|uniref:probable beta-1,3-galactosyltransferase 12 isoform X2 n=1 Tax=Beta vulgaris subsp. vulgaris TaxID=3555 RepID=UPI002547B462|nr:probable beta-1,3-galactosyltransferase 12 isoform X2 [Beta vulgaris subsp. vulgaris]